MYRLTRQVSLWSGNLEINFKILYSKGNEVTGKANTKTHCFKKIHILSKNILNVSLKEKVSQD
jgi:hypothetical protein